MRRAVAADRAALGELRWRWRVEERCEHGMEHDEFIASFIRWAGDRDTTHLPFIAESAEGVVGMAWLALLDRIPGPQQWERRAGSVMSVYVVPERRNAGIGERLMQALIAEARSRRLEYLAVHIADRAEHFYRRLGFSERDNAVELDLRPRQ